MRNPLRVAQAAINASALGPRIQIRVGSSVTARLFSEPVSLIGSTNTPFSATIIEISASTQHQYRGTPDASGLVLGFDCGSPRRGLAFWIAVEDSEIIVDCFNGRELVGNSLYAEDGQYRTVG